MVVRSIVASWAQAQMCSIVLCLGSIAGVLDRIDRDSCANFHPQTAFSFNDLLHTKTLKLTKTLDNKAKSLTNIS